MRSSSWSQRNEGHSASTCVNSLKWRRVLLASTETLLNTENISQSRDDSFQVKLTALGQVRRFSVVIQVEEGGTAFALRLDQAGRVTSKYPWSRKCSRKAYKKAERSFMILGSFSTQNQVTLVERTSGLASVFNCVFEGIFTTRSGVDQLPMINDKFNISRGRLTLRNQAHPAVKGNSRFSDQLACFTAFK